MNNPVRTRAATLGACLLLAACGSSDKPPVAVETDPALSGALGDQIMVDPQMVDEQGGALAAGGNQVTLPPEDRSAEAADAARARAAEMAGGSLLTVPAPAQGGIATLAEGVATAAQVAQAARLGRTDCAGKVQYSNVWAARLPPELPVYPRGAVQEAAGIDSEGCLLRVVNFLTPVTPDDVMAFYYTRASKAGYGATHRAAGSEHALGGRRNAQAFAVYARRLDGGVTEVDLVTSGR